VDALLILGAAIGVEQPALGLAWFAISGISRIGERAPYGVRSR
jgi:hypothetical protein